MDWNELKNHTLKIYSTPWCGDCKRLKSLFDEWDIEYSEIDIDANQEAAMYLLEKTGKKAIPFVEIDDKHIIRGWHVELPNRWADQVFFDEVTEALNN